MSAHPPEPVKWEIVEVMPLWSEMSEEQREAFQRLVVDGVVECDVKTLDEIRALYG